MKTPSDSSTPEFAAPMPGKRTDLPGEFSRENVSAELDRITASEGFTGAPRQQKLLRHLVSKRLDGALDDLKEYTLGVEVFNRGEDFDPRLDPIVRVEASRLRSRLKKYYETDGSANPIWILLPRGGYVPAFSEPQATPVPESPAPATVEVPISVAAPPVPAKRGISRWIFAAVAGLSLAGLLFVALHRPHLTTSEPAFTRFRRVTSDEAQCTSPSFAPDDRAIAYSRPDSNGTWQIYIRQLNSLTVNELTSGSSADNVEPTWSPDGHSIAFRSERDGGGIFLGNVRTGRVQQLSKSGFNPSWAPDGHRLVFATGGFGDPIESGFGSSTLEIADVAARKVRNLVTPEGPFSARQPAWSPHGQRIAYWETDANGDRDIWTVSSDGSNPPVRVTHDAWTDWSPAWSPDGAYLYFASDRGGAMNIWRVRVDESTGMTSSDPEPVTTPSSYTGWVAFAHSGKEFAYVRRIPFSELYRVPLHPWDPKKGPLANLNDKVQLTFGERGMHEPDMSPDSQWIVVRIQDPQEDLALIKADGSDFRRLTNDPYTERNPHWTPDGKEIVFASNRSRAMQLWGIHPDGTGLHQITRNGIVPYAADPQGTFVEYPSDGRAVELESPSTPAPDAGIPAAFRPITWSPDGRKVAGRLRGTAFSGATLFVYTPATQDFWEVASNAGNGTAEFTPDSRDLVFSRSDGIYEANTDSKDVQLVLPTQRNGVHSVFTMSKDGQQLYFVQSSDQEDIWTAGE